MWLWVTFGWCAVAAGLAAVRIWVKTEDGAVVEPATLHALDRFSTAVGNEPGVSSVIGPTTLLRLRRYVAGQGDALPEDVRRRFSKRLTGRTVATYSGEIVWTRLSISGWLLAQACRLIGAPLPLAASGPAPAAAPRSAANPS